MPFTAAAMIKKESRGGGVTRNEKGNINLFRSIVKKDNRQTDMKCSYKDCVIDFDRAYFEDEPAHIAAFRASNFRPPA